MENSKIKIVFIGTPEFGAVILEAICQANMAPILVVTAPDKPVGRKQVVTPSPVKIVAQRYNIPVRHSMSNMEDLKPDLIVVAAYGQILPKEILEITKYGCLNVHPSLLPKYRGATPVQFAILNGEKETGVTIMLMDEGIDTGPIISQNKTVIGPNETGKQLRERLAVLGADLLTDIIPDWVEGKIMALPQNEKEATYTKILTREDGLIDLGEQPADILYRKIKAFNPWPGTYHFYKNRKIKILEARLENNKLIVEKVQLEGRKPTTFDDFKRGHSDA